MTDGELSILRLLLGILACCHLMTSLKIDCKVFSGVTLIDIGLSELADGLNVSFDKGMSLVEDDPFMLTALVSTDLDVDGPFKKVREGLISKPLAEEPGEEGRFKSETFKGEAEKRFSKKASILRKSLGKISSGSGVSPLFYRLNVVF